MGKTYIDTVKYKIVTEFEIKGTVDKNDIIGAVFGQSEGLLGADMDLKELQQNGKIGRIDVEVSTNNGKTNGKIFIPSSMDMVKTSILAAAVESIEKVGPAESEFKTIAIEDTRSNKRSEIKNRAKELLQKLMHENLPETDEIADEVKETVRVSDVKAYGKEKLPSGPEIQTSKEIIVVEGRADVINLLRFGMKNVIGMDGAKLPQEIIDLSKQKQVTLFIDGDRGGILNARNFKQLANPAFIARAPDGKEVEELTRKEIIMALRKKVPAEKFTENHTEESITTTTFNRNASPHPNYRDNYSKQTYYSRDTKPEYDSRNTRPRFEQRDSRPRYDSRQPFERKPFERRESFGRNSYDRRPSSNFRENSFNRPRNPRFGNVKSFDKKPRFETPKEEQPFNESITISEADKKRFEPIIKELHGTLKAKMLSARNKELASCSIRDITKELGKTKRVNAIVLDGIVTKRLTEEAIKNKVKTIVGVRIAKFEIPKEIQILKIGA